MRAVSHWLGSRRLGTAKALLAIIMVELIRLHARLFAEPDWLSASMVVFI